MFRTKKDILAVHDFLKRPTQSYAQAFIDGSPSGQNSSTFLKP